MQFGCVDAAEMQYNQWSVGVQPTANQLEAAKPYLMIGGYAALWDYGFAPPPYNPPNPIQNAKAWLADGYVLVISIDPNSPGFPGQSGICTPLPPSSIPLTLNTITTPDTRWPSAATTTISIPKEKARTIGVAS